MDFDEFMKTLEAFGKMISPDPLDCGHPRSCLAEEPEPYCRWCCEIDEYKAELERIKERDRKRKNIAYNTLYSLLANGVISKEQIRKLEKEEV